MNLLGGLGVGDQAAGHLFQQPGEGEEQRRAQDVKGRMHHGNAQLVNGMGDKRELDHRVDAVEDRQPNRGSYNIKEEMHHSRPLGVLVGPHRGDHRRHASADVLPHDNGDRRAIGHLPRGRERLQNTHRGRGALDNRRQARAGQHPQNRVAEHQEDIPEFGHLFQAGHRAAHGVHAEHQHGKAQQDHPHVLFLVAFGHHGENHADERQNGGKRSGFEQHDKKIVSVQTR